MTTGETRLSDLVEALSSGEPAPGGGAAAALAGALGVSLLIMVARLASRRLRSGAEAERLAELAARLRSVRDGLVALADRDRAAYAGVMEARRRPKGSASEAAGRTAAIQAALTEATEVPVDTMRRCRAALGEAIPIARASPPGARGDLLVGVELLLAGLRGAGHCVDGNLPGLADAGYVARARTARAQLEEEGGADALRFVVR